MRRSCYQEVPGNLAFDYETGNRQAVEEAFSKAAHVARVKVEVTRVAPNPMELRGCTVAHDPQEDAYHLYMCIQGINMTRKQASFATDVPEDRIYVHAEEVGGSFGQRAPSIPRTACRCWRRRNSAGPCAGYPAARKAS